MENKQPKYLTETEVSRFLQVIAPARDRALFTVLYYHGLRASEPRLIKRHHVDLIGQTIQIQRLKNSNGGLYQLAPVEAEALKTWMEDGKCPKRAEHRLFEIQRAQIWGLFKKYAEMAELPEDRRHPHVLKHSIATHMISKGISILDVQDWLGHRNLKNTAIYARVTSERRMETARKLYGTG